MLILPIVNRNRILNVEVKLKDASKIRSGVKFDDALQSDIIVNGKKLSESTYKNEKDSNAVLDFIRNNSLVYKRNYLITTRENADSSLYDVYEVSQPPKKVNDSLDGLYTSVVTDMRKEIPGIKRGRYISFEKLGMDKHLTDEKISKLKRIVEEVRDTGQWPVLFEQEGIADLPQIIEFINNFDCTVVENSTISEGSLQELIKALEQLNSNDARNLRKYYDMALSNKNVYSKISNINQLIYDKPLTLIQSKSQRQKQLVKTNNMESELKKVA